MAVSGKTGEIWIFTFVYRQNIMYAGYVMYPG